jgi:hypothetical protein
MDKTLINRLQKTVRSMVKDDDRKSRRRKSAECSRLIVAMKCGEDLRELSESNSVFTRYDGDEWRVTWSATPWWRSQKSGDPCVFATVASRKPLSECLAALARLIDDDEAEKAARAVFEQTRKAWKQKREALRGPTKTKDTP